MNKYLFIMILSAVSLSCGTSDDENSANVKKESYQYCLQNVVDGLGCSTGVQKYDSKESYCTGLQDEYRNNYCQRDSRQRSFESQQCSGEFKPTSQDAEPRQVLRDDQKCPERK